MDLPVCKDKEIMPISQEESPQLLNDLQMKPDPDLGTCTCYLLPGTNNYFTEIMHPGWGLGQVFSTACLTSNFINIMSLLLDD